MKNLLFPKFYNVIVVNHILKTSSVVSIIVEDLVNDFFSNYIEKTEKHGYEFYVEDLVHNGFRYGIRFANPKEGFTADIIISKSVASKIQLTN